MHDGKTCTSSIFNAHIRQYPAPVPVGGAKDSQHYNTTSNKEQLSRAAIKDKENAKKLSK